MIKRILSITLFLILFITTSVFAGALFNYPKFVAYNSDGDPLIGGKVYTYIAGTTTAKTTYSDRDFATPNANPVILDARGEAVIYGLGTYKLILRDSDDNLIWTFDNFNRLGSGDYRLNAYYPDASESDQGAVSVSGAATVKDFVDAIGGSQQATIVFLRGDTGNTTDYTFLTSETVPSNITLELETGARISIAGGETLTINSPFENGLYQVFAGAGAIAFGTNSLNQVSPTWWGENSTPGTTDMTAEIQAAVNSLPTGGVIKLGLGNHLTSSVITITSDDIVINIPTGTTISLAVASNCNMFSVSSDRVRFLGGGTIDGNRADQTGGGVCDGTHVDYNGIYTDGTEDFVVRDLLITDVDYRGIRTGGTSYRTVIDNVRVTDCGCDGIYIGTASGHDIKIINNYADNCDIDNPARGNINVSEYAGSNILISKNTTLNAPNNNNGLWVGASGNSNVRVTDNYSYNNGHNGLEVLSLGSIITGNHCIDNGQFGAEAAGIYFTSKSIVSGNVCMGNYLHGIRCITASHFIISNNILMNNTGGATSSGIRLSTGPSEAVIIGNVCTDDQVTKTQSKPIHNSGGESETIYVGNYMKGNDVDDFLAQLKPDIRNVANIEEYTDPAVIARADMWRVNTWIKAMTGNEAFEAGSHIFIRDPNGADRNFNPTGTFWMGHIVFLINTDVGAANTITFDSAGLNQAVAQNERGIFVFDGTNWRKIYVGS